MRAYRSFILGAAALAACIPGAARRHSPYEGPRIYWDIESRQTIFNSGSYARLIQLHDGRLLAVGESGGGVSINWSQDLGKTWGTPRLIVANEERLPFAVPDVIQLENGDIVIGYNPRPSAPYSPERKFGIRCVRSADNGATWSDQIIIYNASHEGSEGCWEPCFLELPSGELQCYFANEHHFPDSGEQEISMCRSFDGGKTWSSDNRICFSAGSRDGMPVPILTEKGEIAVIIEDNGWPGYGGFRATTVRTPLEDNWKDWVGRNGRRKMIFAAEADKNYISAAPYIRKLGTNATLASWQGDRPPRQGLGESYFDMYVGVGDSDGNNVKAIVAPFGLPTDQHGLWNSVTALDDGTVFAVSSVGTWTGQQLCAMKGYALEYYEAAFGTPIVDASCAGETWTAQDNRQVYLGAVAVRKQSTFDFLYDDEKLYLYGRVADSNTQGAGDTHDGVTIALDMVNASDQYPQPGMYSFFLDADGSVKMMTGQGNKWMEADTPVDMEYKFDSKRNYYEVEAAIPWSVLGYEEAPLDSEIRCYLEVADGTLKEAAPDAVHDSSWTWPLLRLLPKEGGDNGENSVTITEAGEDFDPVYYDLTGMRVTQPVPGRIYILHTPAKTYKIVK